MEELVHLQRQEGGQLTARGQGWKRRELERKVSLYLEVPDGRNYISPSGS